VASRLLLLAAGAAGAVLVRRVYLASVAFPRAVAAAGAQIAADVAEVRRFADELGRLGVPDELGRRLMAEHIAGWRARR
jgi:hypothetical protein